MMAMMQQMQQAQAAAAQAAAAQAAALAQKPAQAAAGSADAQSSASGLNPAMMAMMMMGKAAGASGAIGGAMNSMGMMMGAQAGAQPSADFGPASTGSAAGRSAPYKEQVTASSPGAHPNVFIGNLPRHMSEADLKTMFETCGTVVSCKVSMDPSTGKSKGSGFVKFSNAEEAAKAINTMNGQQSMSVKFAFSEGGKAPAKAGPPPSDNLYVRGLPSPQPQPEQLNSLFTDLGLNIVRSKVIADTKGAGASAALVQLASVDQATEAINKINGTEHFGNMIFLSYVERPSGGMPAGGGPIDYSKLILKVKFDGGDEADNNLYVGGLPSPQIDQEQLTRLFTDLGLTIARSKILSDNRGKGFSSALVQMRSHEDAKFAIDSLNGKTAESFGLKAVPLSEPSSSPAWLQTQSTGARSSSALSAMPVPEVTHGNLFIGSLPRGFGETELNKLFEECGTIVSCKITRTYEGESKGSGFVKMSCAE